MPRVAALAVGLSLLLACPTRVLAQPEPDYPEATPAPPPVPPPPLPHYYVADPRSEKERNRQIHQMLLDTSPDYRAAMGRRTTGIVVASVVGSLGLAVGVIAGMVTLLCSVGEGDACDGAKAWTIGGFVSMGIGLGVGIPLAVSGHSRVKQMRAEALRGSAPPRLRLSFARSRGSVGLSWRF